VRESEEDNISFSFFLFLMHTEKKGTLRNYLVSILETLPRSNKHGRKRPHTKKYDDLHVRTKMRSFTVLVNGDCIRSPFCSVFLRIRIRRYMIVIRSQVLRQNMVVNDRIFPVYDLLADHLVLSLSLFSLSLSISPLLCISLFLYKKMYSLLQIHSVVW
jgi:hypothetical protein